MLDLLALQKYFILSHLREGDVAVDFTMGNGHDTEFLSKTVGDSGRVYAFDIQEAAVRSTEKHLKECGAPENYTLICDSHHNAHKYVEGKIKAGMFNLGWLPGGDKRITTLRETTLPALADAVGMLGADAVLTVAVYPGHEEGNLEGIEVEEYFSSLSRFRVSCTKIKIVNSPTSPFFFVIETK